MEETKEEEEMFPKDILLKEAFAAINTFNEFKIYNSKEGYTFIKYNNAFSGTFPDISKAKNKEERRLMLIRRECRGITFHTKR
jgi:hypothetical protein